MQKTTLLSALLLMAVPAFAQTPASPPSPLPVRQVTLFTSGVAYTERDGEVEGDAIVPLLFRTAQINDILKSMVLLDKNGRVQPATYAARDPIGHTLQSFAIDVTRNMSQQEILSALRGTKVAVEAAGKTELTGQIVGVEARQVAGDDGKPITVPFLNLLGESGLTSVRLDAGKTIRLLDERLNREFHEALTLLASGSDEQRRQVTLHFAGSGKRQVRVGYVTEAPLWKMSYRLLLGGAGHGQPAGTPYMQGWAMVENTSDDDWQNVKLSLVSGRPISFIQDLYQPLYLPRPVVPPDVVASPYPQTHGENLQTPLAGAPSGPQGEAGESEKAARRLSADNSIMTLKSRDGGFGGGGLGGGAAEVNASVIAQASGQSAGELFAYNISTPVDLPRQQAAMIPVIAQEIDGEKVSIYNADTDGRFPLNAVRVHNTTGLHLKGGPVTIFDEGVYAGDARMEDIPPGDSRLVSYAVDLSIEGERQGPGTSTTDTTLSLRRGVLTVSRRERVETNYTLKSKADKERTVLIEHPFRADYKLLQPEKAAERTASLYRFSVTVPAGKTETLKVVTERPISQTVAVLDAELPSLSFYANRKDISQKLRETLQEIVQRRRHVQELQAQAAGRDTEIKSIGDDQDRIRKNMAALDKTSALYKRYAAELDDQETRLQSLRQDATRLRKQAADADADLRAYLDTITIED